MEQNQLLVESRGNVGKGVARKLRRAGKLPGVLYGLGQNVAVIVDPRVIQKNLLEEGGSNKVFTLKGEGVEGKSALIKDWQVDPVKRHLLHVDLLEIDITKKVLVTVPVVFVGKSAGVAEGGVLNVIARQIEVRCVPTKIPKHIEVDVTSLTIGHSIHLDELALPEGVEKGSAANVTLVACVPPAKEEDAVASLAPTAEPEVITEKKPAEGEAAAADAKGGEKKDEKKK